jgi:penicillin-binding protein 2
VGPRVALTLDAGLQATLEKAFAGRGGAAVALDPNTGEILAMSSVPAFDPNQFAIGLDTASWTKLRTDPGKPLMNRVIQGQYAPGSTFKLATAIAALEEKVITPETRIHCSGVYVKYDRVYHCHELGPHGSVNVEQAIAASCNIFFYEVGVRLEIERLARYAQALGLGSRSGVDLPSEEAGLVPTPKWKKERLNQEWYPGETPMVAIGQTYSTVTAMQLARMGAAVSTGMLVTPHLVRRVGDQPWWKGQPGQPPPPKALGFKPETLAVVRRGMRGVTVPGGTGWRAGLPGVAVCGKTGTAQVVTKSRLAKDDSFEVQPHGWFVGFAPAEEPKIAVAVLVEHAGGGGKAAAPIARELFAQYLGVKVTPLPPPVDAPPAAAPTALPTAAPTPPTPTPAVIAGGAP